MGAGSTQTQSQVILGVNGKNVTSGAELQAALDALAPGASVKLAYKGKGVDRLIEGVVK